MRDERITIRVSKRLMALLESRATSERKTKSDLIREILKSRLQALAWMVSNRLALFCHLRSSLHIQPAHSCPKGNWIEALYRWSSGSRSSAFRLRRSHIKPKTRSFIWLSELSLFNTPARRSGKSLIRFGADPLGYLDAILVSVRAQNAL